MTQPIVSVIMPAFNAEATISRAVHSVLKQDYYDLELIVVNDGSTDETKKILESIEDDRIVVINQHNMGLSGARNSGVSAVKGKYITFVDSDDWIDDNHISSLVKSIQDNHADLVICGMTREHPDYKQTVSFKNSASYHNCMKNDIFLSLFEGGLINSCCNKLYRTSLILDNHFIFSGKSLVEDIEFNLMYLQKANIVNTLTICSYHYLMNNESLTSKVSEEMFDNYIAVQKQFLDALDEKDKNVANIFVYHQYLSIIMKYLHKVAFKKMSGKNVYSILNKYISNTFVKESFKSYKPKNKRESIIHNCIWMKFYHPLILYIRYKDA